MESRFYQASGLNIERIIYDFEGTFLAQGYQVQHFGDRGRTIVQLKKGGDFEAILGMQAALTVILEHTSGGLIAMIGHQKWVDKAVVGTIGMIFLWPLLLTAGAGLIRQSGLEAQVLGALDTVVRKQRADVYCGPVPPQFQDRMQQYTPQPEPQTPPSANIPSTAEPQQSKGATSGTIQCLHCQETNEADDFYCSRCGKPLALLKKRCPQCQAEIKASAAFCTRCGSAFSQS